MSHSKVQIVTRVTVPSFRSCKTWVLERGGGFTQLLKLVVSIITPNKHSDYNYTEYYFNFWRTINTLDSYLSFRRKEYAIHYHWRKPLTNDLTFTKIKQVRTKREGRPKFWSFCDNVIIECPHCPIVNNIIQTFQLESHHSKYSLVYFLNVRKKEYSWKLALRINYCETYRWLKNSLKTSCDNIWKETCTLWKEKYN